MEKEGADGANEIRFSVIIPTLNEERVVGRCLEALSKSKFPSISFEVIIVDNGSTDRTLELVHQYSTVFYLRIVVLKGVYISALRNRGAREARGEIFAFLDADCLPPPDWLTNADRIFESPSEGTIGAQYKIPEDATWVGRTWFDDRSSQKVGAVKYVPAGDLLMRRELFNRVGGFDESIQTNEDFELCQRVIELGWPVKAYDELQVIHLGTPRTLSGFFKKQRWHGTHVFRVFLRDPEKRKNIRPVMLSLYSLLCLLGLALGLVAAALGLSHMIPLFFALMLVCPLAGISLARSVARGKLRDALPLTILYLTFGIARARSLLDYREKRSH